MATSRISESGPSSRTARITPPTIVIGAATSSVHVISTSICTCLTSLVMRVISDGAPKWPTSWAEKSVTLWNRSPRTSRPKPMAERAPKYTAAIANTTWTKRDAEHHRADLPDVAVRPVTTLLSMMSAFSVGSVSVATDWIVWNTSDEDQPLPVLAEVLADESDQHDGRRCRRRRMPSRSTATISSDVSGSSVRTTGARTRT